MAIEQALTGAVSSAINPAIAGAAGESPLPPDLWVDPAIDSKRVMNGGNVVTLQKLAGTLADPTQATPAKQPFYRASVIKGLGVMEQIDTARNLESLNPSANNANISFVAQFCFRYTASVPARSYVLSFNWHTSTPQLQYLFTLETDGTLLLRPLDGAAIVGSVNSSVIPVNTPVIITIIYDVQNSLHALYVNGSPDGSSSSVISRAALKFDAYFLNLLGLSASNPGLQLGAFMMNIYTLPSANQIKARENYLMSRYI